MSGYFRLTPEYIATHPSLNDGARVFYGLLFLRTNKYGFCWETNEDLAKDSKKTPRTIQRYIELFKNNGLIIVEIVGKNYRRIWMPETWGNRKNLLEAWRRDYPGKDFKKSVGYDMDDVGGTTCVTSPYIYKDKEYNKKKDIKHIEAWAKPLPKKVSLAPIASNFSLPGVKQLPEMLKDSPPPTPGPPQNDCDDQRPSFFAFQDRKLIVQDAP